MPVPSSLASLSTTPGSNSPGGGENPFPELDDHLRQGYAFTAQLRDQKLNSSAVSAYMLTVLDDANAGAARTTLGAVGNSGNETIAGVKTFSSAPVSSAAAVAANELMRKGEVDSAVAGKAALAGSASQVFNVAAATAAEHATRLGQFLAAVSGADLSLEIPCSGLPGGATKLIIKIGKLTSAADNSYTTVTFPAAFPNVCFGVYVTTLRGAALASDSVISSFGYIIDRTQIAIGVCTNAAISSPDVQWIAVGY